MLSDEWLSRYGLLQNFNASVTRTRTGTRTGTGTGTWTTGVTAIALCTSCSRAKNSTLIKYILETSRPSPLPHPLPKQPGTCSPLTLNLTSPIKDSNLIKYFSEISSIKYFTYKHGEVYLYEIGTYG